MKGQPTTEREIEMGDRRMIYRLTRKSIKNLIIHVKPDRQIWVSAPKRVPLEAIDRFVRSKEMFISRALHYFENRPEAITCPTYRSVERFFI